jgi:predicted nucleic acid-binding protein
MDATGRAAAPMILVDASFLIRALVPGSPQDSRLREWLAAGEELGLSAVAWCEFLCGPVAPRLVDHAARIVPRRFAFEDEEAALAATLFNQAGRRRGSLPDCMIAATAIRLAVPLATENAADFRRFEPAGLVVVSA